MRFGLCLLVGGVLTVNVLAQSPVGEPRFDAASIRPSANEQGVPSAGAVPGRYTARGMTLGQLIGLSFGEERPLARQQLANISKWFAETRFDVEATSPVALDSVRALNPTGKAMLRSLLAERFNLKAHFETRDQPVLALQLARADRRLGSALKPRSLGCAGTEISQICGWTWGVGRIAGNGLTMNSLADLLSGLVPEIDRFVVDRTTLTGLFDLRLQWSPETAVQPRLAPGQQSPLPAVSGVDAPSFFTALREQLGLKLEPDRAPIPMLVIDSVSQLTEN